MWLYKYATCLAHEDSFIWLAL